MRRFSWKGLLETLGVVGIIGSLIFVAIEVRQNTAAATASTIQAILDTSMDATVLPIQNPDLRAARLAACDDAPLTEDQKLQLNIYYGAMMRAQMSRFYHVRLHVIDEETALELGGRGGVHRNPYFSEFWENSRDIFGEDFRNFIEMEVLPLSGSGC